MFASNLSVKDSDLVHIRGEDKLTSYSTSETINSGNTMTSSFCSVCGTLMYRRSSGFPGLSFARIGTIDDIKLHDTLLAPQAEQFIQTRAAYLVPIHGVSQFEGMSTK